MIDTRAVAQEVQDQLHAAVQRGQEQLRKSQDQVRQGREAVTGVIRSSNQRVKAVRPNIPALPAIVCAASASSSPFCTRASGPCKPRNKASPRSVMACK